MEKQKKVKHFTLTNDGYQMLQRVCDLALKSEGMGALPVVNELFQKHLKPEIEEEKE